jgi:hypothetical protein
VDFVDDVDFAPTQIGYLGDFVSEVSNGVNRPVGGGVYLDNVGICAGRYRAGCTIAAWWLYA